MKELNSLAHKQILEILNRSDAPFLSKEEMFEVPYYPTSKTYDFGDTSISLNVYKMIDAEGENYVNLVFSTIEASLVQQGIDIRYASVYFQDLEIMMVEVLKDLVDLDYIAKLMKSLKLEYEEYFIGNDNPDFYLPMLWWDMAKYANEDLPDSIQSIIDWFMYLNEDELPETTIYRIVK